jgi:hypothetical protein
VVAQEFPLQLPWKGESYGRGNAASFGWEGVTGKPQGGLCICMTWLPPAGETKGMPNSTRSGTLKGDISFTFAFERGGGGGCLIDTVRAKMGHGLGQVSAESCRRKFRRGLWGRWREC